MSYSFCAWLSRLSGIAFSGARRVSSRIHNPRCPLSPPHAQSYPLLARLRLVGLVLSGLGSRYDQTSGGGRQAWALALLLTQPDNRRRARNARKYLGFSRVSNKRLLSISVCPSPFPRFLPNSVRGCVFVFLSCRTGSAPRPRRGGILGRRVDGTVMGDMFF